MPFKYYIMPPPPKDAWRGVKQADAERYDLILTDIIEKQMGHTEACIKHGVNPNSWPHTARQQRRLGLTIPAVKGGHKSKPFDPNAGFKYWVAPATCAEHQTEEFGRKMDSAIQELIDGDTAEKVAEKYGIALPTFGVTITRLRKAGSPIPHFPARAWQSKRGYTSEADPEIFQFVDGHNEVKPEVVQVWVAKRLNGFSARWIAGEYRVSPWTVARLTKPFMPK